MRKAILFILLMFCVFGLANAQTGNSTRAAFTRYNQVITQAQKAIFKKVMAFSNEITNVDNSNYEARMNELLAAGRAEINAQLAVMDTLTDPDPRFPMRTQAQALFRFYLGLFTVQYPRMVQLAKQLSSPNVTEGQAESLAQELLEINQAIETEERPLSEALIRTQEAMARETGVGLRDNELQPEIDAARGNK